LDQYYSAGQTFFASAESALSDNNLEDAFINYMRFASLFVDLLPQHAEWHRKSFAKWHQLSRKRVIRVLDKLENLKPLLRAQYLGMDVALTSSDPFPSGVGDKDNDKNDNNAVMTTSQPSFFLPLSKEEKEKRMTTSHSSPLSQSAPLLVPVSSSSSVKCVHLSPMLPMQFLQIALGNTRINKETCGILCGRLESGRYLVTCLLIPQQNGTSNSCETTDEGEILDFMIEKDLISLGWIHTHPSQSCFMSSVDLHTHLSYQLMLPEAVAIVISVKDNVVGYFQLTANGLQIIKTCTLRGFHPHEQRNIYNHSSHIRIDKSINMKVVDLRVGKKKRPP